MENLKINILSKEEIEEIHKATMKVLADPGILVDSQEARDLFKKNGCEVDDETMIVKIPEAVVNKALSTIPPEFTLYSRDGKHDMQWKSDGSITNNNTFGIGTKIIEYAGNGQYIDRESTLKDLGDIAKVADYCDNIDFFCSPVSAMDLADDPVRTLKEMKALLVNSVKPIDLDSDSEFFEEYFEMVAACYGGDKERAKREARAAKMMASRERMLQQQQQYEKSKSGNNNNKKKNQAAKKPEKKAGTNENGRVGQRPYARGRAYSEHHYDE